MGERVGGDDRIVVDGKKLAPQKRIRDKRRVLLYNKPDYEICTRNDPEGRPTVFDKLPPLKHGRWVSIGRLDLNTSVLLLFTTDGELANKLMHPSSEIEREYAVRVMGDVTQEMVDQMHAGLILDGALCRFTDVQYFAGEGLNQWYHVVLMEGKNREVRRLWESQGLKVSRLKRVRFGPIFIPNIPLFCFDLILSFTTSIPSLLKPNLFIIAKSSTSLNTLGLEFPSCFISKNNSELSELVVQWCFYTCHNSVFLNSRALDDQVGDTM